MSNKELAIEFVKKYPNMFNNEADNNFWIEQITDLLERSNKLFAEDIIKRFFKE